MSGTRNAAITANEALELLASAVNYCQQAGLRVRVANGESGLLLAIAGAYYASNPVRFIAGKPGASNGELDPNEP